MALYRPGTEETDLKKVIMSLQATATAADTNTTNIAANAADIAAIKAAWTAYTPTITSVSGTITTAVGAGRYLTIGKTTFISITATITTNGTGATAVRATLPNTAGSLAQRLTGSTAAGEALVGHMAAAGTSVNMFKYSGVYPGADGAVLILTGVYENA